MPDTPAGTRTLPGFFTFGHEVQIFQACGSDDILWVNDRTDLLRSLHADLRSGVEPYERIFTVVRATADDAPGDGFAAEYDGTLLITEVLYAAREGWGCGTDWDFRFRAAGNEPFWSLQVTRAGLRLSRPGEPDRTWPEYELESGAGLVRITAGTDTTQVHMEIRRNTCMDSMSGAFSPLAAVLRLGDVSLEGCAVEGLSGEADRDSREPR